MSPTLVTVLIDTYNYGHHVEQAVESALAQDFPVSQREILVVDDGSTDDTQERLRKFGIRSGISEKQMEGRDPHSISDWSWHAEKLCRGSMQTTTGCHENSAYRPSICEES
jgi:glycosyltransferase involved in cell wall biosynthesis